MKQTLISLCLILVLLSNRYYVNTDRIEYIDIREKLIKVGASAQAWARYGFLYITDEDIEIIKEAMGVYGDKR